MARSLSLTLLVACLALAPLAFLPGAAALRCSEESREVAGVGDDSVGTYQYHEPYYDSWNQPFCESWTGEEPDCNRTYVNPWTTPSQVVVPEVRVLGQVLVPETPVPLPPQSLPGVDGPETSGCEYGVYYDVAPVGGDFYTLRGEIGTDGCRYDRGSSVFRPAQDAVCDAYYLLT